MSERVWECKIGGEFGELPPGADSPMRAAAWAAFKKVTGQDAQFVFSGWGGSLNEIERAVVEGRLPEPAATAAEAFKTLKTALQMDEGYAWSWHCNIACASQDEGMSHAASNRAAARFMRMCFDVDVTKFDVWKAVM